MTTSETLLKAVFNRLKIRIDKNVTSSVSEASDFLKVAPGRIKKEWDLFKEEIIEEADRINDRQSEEKNIRADTLPKKPPNTLQNKINKIRKEIGKLSIQIEEFN